MMFSRRDMYEHTEYGGVLRCGFSDKIRDAELFMTYVIDPTEKTLVKIDLENGINLDDIKSFETVYACERIFNKCVFLGFMFDSFLKACEDLKSLDPWFMSNEFMSEVWAGGIRGNWSIMFQHENGDKEPYRKRFRKFIDSLDARGLGWTEKYLEPDSFWGKKKAYWTE